MYLCATCKHPITNTRSFLGLEIGTCTERKRTVIIPWVTSCPNYEKSQPPPQPMITDVGKTYFDIMVIDDLSESRIRDAVGHVPQHVSLKLVPPDPSRYTEITEDGAWKGFVHPKETEDHLIVVFDGRKRGFGYAGGACVWNPDRYHRIGISDFGEPLPVIGLRFEHEILHCIEVTYMKKVGLSTYTGDADRLWNDEKFVWWLEPQIRGRFLEEKVEPPGGRHSPQWERLFYTYLWEKYYF